MSSYFLRIIAVFAVSALSGCASYSITEAEINDYVSKRIAIDQSIGVPGLATTQLVVDDIDVRIGENDSERVSVFANTNAVVEFWGATSKELDLSIQFSAIPEYEAETGEVYLKSLRLEQFEDRSNQLPGQLTSLLEPAVSVIGQILSQQPVYQLDSSSAEQALLKSANPELKVKNGKLVIDLL